MRVPVAVELRPHRDSTLTDVLGSLREAASAWGGGGGSVYVLAGLILQWPMHGQLLRLSTYLRAAYHWCPFQVPEEHGTHAPCAKTCVCVHFCACMASSVFSSILRCLLLCSL